MSETTGGLPDLNGLLDELAGSIEHHAPSSNECGVCRLFAAVRAVAELADELEDWRMNAIRYAETHPPGVEVAQAKTRALAYQRAIAGIRAALAAALAPTGADT